jgi:hypothetical protein
MFLASGGLLGALAAIPLVVAIPISADPNPLGYLIVLLGVPIGGLAYRIRSRNYPLDDGARSRLVRYCALPLLLPALIAILTGMRAQGFMMTIVGFVIALSIIFGILLAGSRRQRSGEPSDAPESASRAF